MFRHLTNVKRAVMLCMFLPVFIHCVFPWCEVRVCITANGKVEENERETEFLFIKFYVQTCKNKNK